MKNREVVKIVQGSAHVDGAGVHLTRVIGMRDVRDFDPFLMFDAFDSTNPADYVKGFPWHPHRGIETVTYLIQGNFEHRDSLGNVGNIGAGDCQWMTAGSGIIHQEMPQASDRMLGAQLWINLPQKDKMTYPEYNDIKSEQIPLLFDGGAEIRIIAGRYGNTDGAMQGKYVDATYLDVKMQPNSELVLNTPLNETVFVYMVQGEGAFGTVGKKVITHAAALFSDGEEIFIRSFDSGVRMLVLMGKSLNEPISWGGPVVMNTKAEIETAFDEMDNGTFVKHAK